MTLAQMQARFFELKGKLAVGQIGETEFKQELEKLRFQDAQGRWWMIGAQSGRWYYYNGERWLLGEPPDPNQSVPLEPVTVFNPSQPSPRLDNGSSRQALPFESRAAPRQSSPVRTTPPGSLPYTPSQSAPGGNIGGNQPSQTVNASYRHVSPSGTEFGTSEPRQRAPSRNDPLNHDNGQGWTGAATWNGEPNRNEPGNGNTPDAQSGAAMWSANAAATGNAAALGDTHKSSIGETIRHDLSQVHLPQVHVPHVERPNLHAPAIHLPPQVVSHTPAPIRRMHPLLLILGAIVIGLVLVGVMWLGGNLLTQSLGGASPTRPVARSTAVQPAGAQNVDNLLRVGDELVAKSQFDPALQQFQAAARYDPNEADVYTHWARALALSGRIGEAIQTAQKATRLDPTSSKAYAELTRALAWAGQNTQAINNGEKAIQLDPQNATAHAFLSEAYLRAGRNNDAQQEADTALELDDANSETHRAAGWVAIASNRKDEGVGEWRRVIELAPEVFLYQYELGQVYANHLNDAESAIPAYQRAIQLYPPYIPSYTALGRAYLMANQPAPAVLQFQKALTLDKKSTEAFVGLGDAFRLSQRCQQAIPYYQEALGLNQDLAAANEGLQDCNAIAKGGEPSQAVAQATPGLSILPTAVVQGTVVPLVDATPTPKAQSNNKVVPANVPNGEGRILFPVYDGQYRIYSSNPDGSDRQLVAELASSPAYNADGSAVLYYSWVNDQRGIHRADASGGGDRHISLYAEDTLPSSSPDGARYVYVTRAGQGSDINRRAYSVRVSSTGAKPRQGPPPLIEQAQYPTWGPDGRIVFRDCGFPDQTCGLAIVNADGSDKHEVIPNNINATAPAWSPDSSKIVFMSNLVGNWDIYIVGTEGGSPLRLTDDPGEDGLPTFSPDGKSIAFVSNRGGTWAIYAMDLDGENEHKLFELEGNPAGSVAGNPPAQPGQVWTEQRISWR